MADSNRGYDTERKILSDLKSCQSGGDRYGTAKNYIFLGKVYAEKLEATMNNETHFTPSPDSTAFNDLMKFSTETLVDSLAKRISRHLTHGFFWAVFASIIAAIIVSFFPLT